MTNSTLAANTVRFSTSAADVAASLIAKEDNPDLKYLRISIAGGGCSGFQYEFNLDKEIQSDDTVIEQFCSDNVSVVKLLIDPISHGYLENADIDYVKNIQGEQFVIRNPNAKTTCGCGSSFSIDEE